MSLKELKWSWCQPFLRDLTHVLGIIILLKDQPTWIQIIILFYIVDHKKFSKTNLYKFLSILSSILYHAPGPKAVMRPQIITDLPPSFTV